MVIILKLILNIKQYAEDVLLTALADSYRWVTGERSVSVQMEGHGRERFTDDLHLDRTIGWFTSLYPVILETDGKSVLDDLLAVKEELRRVPGRGAGYAVLRYLCEEENGTASTVKNTPKLGFNYLGDMSIKSDGDSLFTLENGLDTGMSIAPENKRAFGQILSVNCEVVNARLCLTLDFDPVFISDDDAEIDTGCAG